MIDPIQPYLGEPGKRVIPLPAFWKLETSGPVTSARVVLDDPDLKHSVRPSSDVSPVLERMAEEIHADLAVRFALADDIANHILFRDDVSDSAKSMVETLLRALDLWDEPAGARKEFEKEKRRSA